MTIMAAIKNNAKTVSICPMICDSVRVYAWFILRQSPNMQAHLSN